MSDLIGDAIDRTSNRALEAAAKLVELMAVGKTGEVEDVCILIASEIRELKNDRR